MTKLVDLRATVSFASKEILEFITEKEKKFLQKEGAKMRARAMREIKSAPAGKAAEPGKSFHSHSVGKRGSKRNSGIKRAIQYALDPANKSVVIGPAWAQELYERHEYGDVVELVNKRRKREKRVGDVGILVRGRTNKRAKKRDNKAKGGPAYAVNPVDRKSEWEGGAKIKEPVLYAPIKTEAQARRVNENEEDIYGPLTIKAEYPARPVMENTLKNNPNAMAETLRAVYGMD